MFKAILKVGHRKYHSEKPSFSLIRRFALLRLLRSQNFIEYLNRNNYRINLLYSTHIRVRLLADF